MEDHSIFSSGDLVAALIHLLTLRLGTKALETVVSSCLGCVCVDVLCCIHNAVISYTAGWLQEAACFGRLHHHGFRHGAGLTHGHWKRGVMGLFSYCISDKHLQQVKLWLLQMIKNITRQKPQVHTQSSGSISKYCVRCFCEKAQKISSGTER